MSTHSVQALSHLEDARSAIDGLAELRRGDHRSHQVASFYDHINQSMKLAEVEALLYIGDCLFALTPAQGSCFDLSPFFPDGVPERCELPAGHAGAHRSGPAEWLEATA